MHPELMESVARDRLAERLSAAERARLVAGSGRPSRLRAALGRRFLRMGTWLIGCIEEGTPEPLPSRVTVSR